MKDYVITYRESYVGVEGWTRGRRTIQCYYCRAESKVDALMQLINREAVHQVLLVKRLKND